MYAAQFRRIIIEIVTPNLQTNSEKLKKCFRGFLPSTFTGLNSKILSSKVHLYREHVRTFSVEFPVQYE